MVEIIVHQLAQRNQNLTGMFLNNFNKGKVKEKISYKRNPNFCNTNCTQKLMTNRQ